MPLPFKIDKTSNRLFLAILQFLAALITSGITGWLLRQEILAAKPWMWPANEPFPEYFIADQRELLSFTLILAVVTAVSSACFVRLFFGNSRYVSRLGLIALSWPLLEGLTKVLGFIGISVYSRLPSIATLLVFSSFANCLPIAPALGLITSIVAIAKKRQLGDLVAIPYTIGWWLLVGWYELTLFAIQND